MAQNPIVCLSEDAGQSVLNIQPTLMPTGFLAACVAPVCISFSYTDFLSTFLVLVEIECIDWKLKIPSRLLREGKDVPDILF
jgi:hypothetical protein